MGNSLGLIFSLKNDGIDCNGLSLIFHRYCHILLIKGGLFLTVTPTKKKNETKRSYDLYIL